MKASIFLTLMNFLIQNSNKNYFSLAQYSQNNTSCSMQAKQQQMSPHAKNLSLGFPTSFDTSQTVQPQKMARGLKFLVDEVEGLHYLAKTETLISCAVTVQLICTFVFTYAKSRYSNDAAHISLYILTIIQIL